MQQEINGFLRQRVDERSTVEQSAGHLLQLQKRMQPKPASPPERTAIKP